MKGDNFQSTGDGRIPAYGGNLNKEELRITNSDKEAPATQKAQKAQKVRKTTINLVFCIMCSFILKISLL